MSISSASRRQRIVARLRRTPVAGWLRMPRKRSGVVFGTGLVVTLLIGSLTACTASPASGNRVAVVSSSPAAKDTAADASKKAHTPTPTSSPVITTKLFTETAPIPFGTKTATSASLPKGTSSITTAGVNGVETKTYTVTYVDGVESTRVLKSDVVTTRPIAQVTTVGTYVAPPAPAAPAAPPAAPAAPSCTNGTYVNSAGNTVCSPEVSSSAPSGATAKCVDGTYSFSQSRRGTCSSHGGVAEWL